GGLLSGRYRYDEPPGPGRFDNDHWGSTGRNLGAVYRDRYWTPRHFAAVDVLREQSGSDPQEMVANAVAWAERRDGVTCVLLGARTADQVRGQLRGITRVLPSETVAALDEVWWGIPRVRRW